ncbi:MAG: glycosyltransferase 87 family protein [Isosphaeraceae bacterium]
MTLRRCLALAVLAGSLQGAFALLIATIPKAYGTVGQGNMVDDVRLYFDYASRTLGGEVPYRDFPVEYPVLALPFFVAPQLVAPDFETYRWAFALEMLAANAAALALVIGCVGRELNGRELTVRLAWYSLTLLALCPMALCRFDLLAMAWTFAAACAFASGKPRLGGWLAGLGFHVKLIPAVTVVPEVFRPSRPRALGVGSVVASVLIGFGLWYALAGPAALRAFSYHLERGNEIGSTWSGVLMGLARMFEQPLSTAYRHKSLEVDTPWVSVADRIAFPAQALALVVVGWRARRSGRESVLRFAAASVLAYVVFGKVLSPQYLLWLIPFVASMPGRSGTWSRGVFLLACLVTTALFPLGFHWLLSFRGWAVGLLNYRNALLVGLWLYWTFGREPARASTTEPPDAALPHRWRRSVAGDDRVGRRPARVEANLASHVVQSGGGVTSERGLDLPAPRPFVRP